MLCEAMLCDAMLCDDFGAVRSLQGPAQRSSVCFLGMPLKTSRITAQSRSVLRKSLRLETSAFAEAHERAS